jgi:hypothetical protein
MIIDTQARRGGGQSGEFKVLDTDVYRAKIVEAKVEEDRFGTPLNDGSLPLKLVIRWEVTEVTDEQDEEAVGCTVWQRLNPWYGTTRDGKPSAFKTFIEALRAQGLIPTFNPSAFDPGDLDGIEQRISVERYIKAMGPNAGSDGNKVTAVLPIKSARRRREEQRAEEVDVL